MQFEAARIVKRIRTALKGESGGQEIAILAWQFAEAVKDANARLEHAIQKLDADDLLSAYLEEKKSPRLLDTCDILDFVELAQWQEQCENTFLAIAPTLDLQKASTLRSQLTNIEDEKEWLYGEYRERLRSKKTLEAYPIIKAIAESDQEDSDNATTECERLKDQLTLKAQGSLNKISEELIPAESPADVIKEYQAAGLKFPDDAEPFQSAIESERAQQIKAATESVASSIETAKEIDSDEQWQAAERSYLACNYMLATTDMRAHIDPDLRTKFEKAGNSIGHKRNSYEANLRIQKCISDVNAAIEKKSNKAASGTFAYSLPDAVERLKSAEMQSKRLGNQISPKLQAEITETLKRAKKSKVPLIVFISLAACLAIVAGLWMMNSMNQKAAEQDAYDKAYIAVKEAQSELLFQEATSTLKKHKQAIESANNSSDLVQESKILQSWIGQQTTLDNDFAQLADRLEQQALNNLDKEGLAETQRLLQGAEGARNNLASDLGQATQKRIDDVKSLLAQSQQEKIAKIKRQVEIAVSQMQRHVDGAVAANNKKDFLTEAQKAEGKIGQLQALIAAHSSIPTLANNNATIKSAQESLLLADSKWGALASTFNKLDEAEDYDEYIAELERIQSFDILPQNQKTDIALVLKNKPSLQDLKLQALMPNDQEGWDTFSTTLDYRKDQPSLNDVERVFLERLANDAMFETIYETKVKYFEGSTIARDEYTIFLYDPVSKVETGLKTGINYTFKVRGFDEAGDPEEEAREMNFLSHPDGTFWGFFYEPSAVSDESQYYEKTIRETLLKILAGAPRFTAIDLIDQLNDARTLAPAFRAYWQQQLFTFMKLNPWKWGMPLSPSLKEQIKKLSIITRGDINKRQWLSNIEQTAPSYDLSEYFRLSSKKDLAQEARAFATMYQFAFEGEYNFAGYADEGGQIQRGEGFEGFKLWAANALTGRYEPISEQSAPAPYSPLIAYQFEDKPSEHILQKTLFITGSNLSSEEFSEHLPPILQKNDGE
ncbi:hypothetical protein MLD52_09480 [Puniceicoccaceae bacterium K14]|nr:hypothetical protein [Puniceicoccaceae bacterium K14]